MIIRVDPKVDFAFKRVFGHVRNTDILIHLLNAILRPFITIVSVEILNPYSEKDFAEDKLTILDVKARDQDGQLFNVEMQLILPEHFRSRIIYYWAGLYRQQLREGDSYSQLRPTISICIVNQTLFPEVDDYHLAFGLYAPRQGLCFSEHIQVHVLELPKFRLRLEELTDPLDKWMYFFLHAESLDPDALPEPLQDPMIQRALKELQMLTQTDLERERYEARQKAIRDQMSFLEEAEHRCKIAEQQAMDTGLQKGLQKGLEQGLEQGLLQGLLQGELIGRIHLCQRRLNRPLTQTDELASLSLEALRQQAEELEAEVFGS